MEKQTKVIVSAETSKYERSMKRLAASDKKITRDMQYRWAKVKSVMTGMVGKVAALAGVGGMIMLGKRALETGDIIHKLNLRLGISTETLSELQHVSNLSGVSFQTTAKSYQKMSENISDAAMGIGTAKDSIADLNMDLSTLHAMSPEKQFEAIADAMTGVVNQSDKIRIAADIFGGRGVEMLQIMDKGASGIREMRDQAQRLGMTLSQDAANSIAAFNDAMERFKGAVMGAARSIMAGLGPELTSLVDWLGEKIPKAGKRAIDFFLDWKAIISGIPRIETVIPNLAELEAMASKERDALKGGLRASPMGGDITPDDTERLATLEADKTAMMFAQLEQRWTNEAEYAGRVKAIEDERLAQTERIENQIVSLRQRSAQSQIAIGRGLFTAGLQLAGVEGKKLFIIQKSIDVGMAIMSAYKASAMALAHPPGPPTTIPLASMVLKTGLLSAAAIAATTIGQMTAPSGSVGGGTYISPTVTTPEEILPTTEERRGSLTINIQGDLIGDDAFIDDLVERINAAEDRDVFINQTNYATELV